MTTPLAGERTETQESAMPQLFSAEIIAVGTELLMGEVINSNAAYLSGELAKIGVDVYFHTTVGDNPARIQGVFRQALERSNLLLVTGGLGPTDDDLTVATLADLLEQPMIRDEVSEAQSKRFFITRDMPMSQTNLKQALRPESAEALFNRTGTAPGLFWDVTVLVAQKGWGSGPKYILAFPGVPREMKAMWEEVALPLLLPRLPEQRILVTRFLKFMGLGESMLAEKLKDLMAQSDPTVSPYVGQAEVKIRIATKAHTEEEGMARIEPVTREILSRVGLYYYGSDGVELEQAVAELLKAHGLTLGVAESCTGGLISSRLTDVPGSSAYTLMNVTTYSNESKTALLGVSPDTLKANGAVSREVAAEMAEGIVQSAGTDVGLSITGIAGPDGGSPEKPVGLAYLGFARKNSHTVVKKLTLNPQYQREQLKHWFSQYTLNYLRMYLQGSLHPD